MNDKISVLALAGGLGSRFKSSLPKQFTPFLGKPLVLHSIEQFSKNKNVGEIIIVCEEKYQTIFKEYDVKFAKPGERRQDSVFSGLQQACYKWVCTHDMVRPFLSNNLIEAIFSSAIQTGAAAPVSPIKYTIKKLKNLMIEETIPREHLYEIHTPQIIRKDLLEKGFSYAFEKKLTVTDDVSLIEQIGLPVSTVQVEDCNIKITTKQDLVLAKALSEYYGKTKS